MSKKKAGRFEYTTRLSTGKHGFGADSQEHVAGPQERDLASMLLRPLYMSFALAIWAIFNPFIITPDGTYLIVSVMSGRYGDTLPVVFSVIVRTILNLTTFVGLITLVQAVFMLFGLRFFAVHVLAMLGHTKAQGELLALGILLILLSPLTPLTFSLVTFLKDYWMMAAMAWAGGFTAMLVRNRSWQGVVGLSISAALVALFRHNSVMLLPIYALVIAVLYSKCRWLSLLPFVLYAASMVAMYSAIPVTKEYVYRKGILLDILGICSLNPKAESDFPKIMEKIRPTYRDTFRFGEIGYADRLGKVPGLSPVDELAFGDQQGRNYWAIMHSESPVSLYTWRIYKYPLELAETKLRAFWSFFWLKNCPEDRVNYIFECGIYPFPIEFKANPYFAETRSNLESIYRWSLERTPLYWVLAYPPIWVLIGLALVVTYYRRNVMWVLLPSSLYPFTFLPVVQGIEYRLLYAAIPLTQVVVLALLFQWCGARRNTKGKPLAR
jgi:hypothetical protein